MKKKITLYISLFLALLIALSCLASCWVRVAYNTEDVNKGARKAVSSEEVTTEAPETADTEPPESESEEVTYDIELESESETETQMQEETIVIEENIYGNYEPPEPETEETEEVVSYTPTVPTGGGRAPLALMYHLILDEPYSSLESLFVRPSELEGQIQALIEKGYTFIFADEYDYYDEKTVIMSFDDGYLDNYTEMFPIIKKYNVKVTVFMISGYIGGADYLSSDMIREMSASGLVSFQSHTNSHIALGNASAETMRDEFEASISIIEGLTGRKVKALCYPTGSYSELAMSVASEYFEFAYTTESTLTTSGYPTMKLPRYRVSRGLSKGTFSNLIP